MEETKNKNYLLITPEAEELIGEILKLGNELAEYFGIESMFEPNRTLGNLYFLFAVNEESSNLDVMFELDINLLYVFANLSDKNFYEKCYNDLVFRLKNYQEILFNLNLQKTKTETMSKKEFFKKFYRKCKKYNDINNAKKEIKYSFVC